MSLQGTPSLTELILLPTGGTTGQVLAKSSNNDYETIWVTGGGGGGTGTVTSVSIVSANGLSGSVANATTTPAITLRVSALDAARIGTGVVSNTEFSYLDGVTSSLQAQFSGKQGNLQFQNQGVDVSTSGGISTINFAGGAVIASATGSVLTVRCSAAGGGSSGTVESVAVVSANGFKGTVASATTTPKITIDVSALNATKIGAGTVDNTEFGYLDGVTSSIQSQFTGKQATGNYITSVSGDGTANGPGAVVFTLSTVNAAVGTYGSAAAVASFTVNGKGLITSASNVPISIVATQISDSGTVGRQILQTATTAAAQQALGAGTFGQNFFAVVTTAAAQNMLEAGAVGLQVFKAATTAAVLAAIDASAKQNIIQFQDEGVNLGTAGSIFTVNFTGAAVEASATGSTLTVRCSAAGGGSSPLTTKGDIYTYTTANDRLPVGANGQILKSNSVQSTGLQWVSDINTVGFSSITPVIGQQGTYVTSPTAGTISAWNIVVDAGSATVKTWKIATGVSAPTAANSINTAGVSISTGNAVRSTTVTDFTTTTVAVNDIMAFELTAVSGVSKLLFQLEITRS